MWWTQLPTGSPPASLPAFTHELLRAVVAGAAGARPEHVTIEHDCPRCGRGSHGRPVVAVRDRPGPHVSLAHAGDIAVVAVARRPVGVDVEPASSGGVDVPRWVRTEAVLKATGHGLAVEPSLVTVSGGGERCPRLLRWDGPGRRPVLRIRDVRLGNDAVAAVARKGRAPLRVAVRSVEC